MSEWQYTGGFIKWGVAVSLVSNDYFALMIITFAGRTWHVMLRDSRKAKGKREKKNS